MSNERKIHVKHLAYITELVSGKEAYNALDLMYPIAIGTVDHARDPRFSCPISPAANGSGQQFDLHPMPAADHTCGRLKIHWQEGI